jgi:eukaryotic-like serine/threonine-protein kinase
MPEWNVPGYIGLKTLGSGGFGEVVLARHGPSGILVAIKYLRRDLSADREFAEIFRAEAAVLASLDDPNVVRLYEYVESSAGAAIVMELIEGVSLRGILTSQGRTTAEAALVVLQGSLLGLAAAHQRGVVHRDYKPENILVNGDGASKLTDFGLAVQAGDRPVPGGTLLYVAPEQLAGAPATPAADVYAATATFYECLTGLPPFTGEPGELILKHRLDPVPLEPVPEPLRPLVTAGLAKDPARRPADAITFVTELGTVAAGAYGPDWADRGRSHLGEAALLLAALWPSGPPPAVQGAEVRQIRLFRRVSPVRVAIAAGIVLGLGAGAAIAVAAAHGPGVRNGPLVTVHPVTLSPTPSNSSSAPASSPATGSSVPPTSPSTPPTSPSTPPTSPSTPPTSPSTPPTSPSTPPTSPSTPPTSPPIGSPRG